MAAPVGSLQWQIDNYPPELANEQNRSILRPFAELMRPTVDAARWIYSKLPDSSTTQMEKLRQRTNQNLSSPADTVAASSPETPSLPLPASDRDFVKYIQEQQARSSLPPGVSAIGESARFYVSPNQPAPSAAASTTPPVYTGGSLPPGVSGIGENARLGLKEVNRYGELLRQGYTPLETQGAAPGGPLNFGTMTKVGAPVAFKDLPPEQQAYWRQREQQRVWGDSQPSMNPGALSALPDVAEATNKVAGRSAPDMSKIGGQQYEQVKYALPGGGEVSGWRAVDPSRPKGSFSVVPGLSDFEKRRYAELMGEERRQAAYQAGQGRQYDALLAKQAEQQVEWNKARLGQENQDRDYEIKRAQLQQSADQNRMNASKSDLEARQKEADALTAALGGVDKMPQYQDYEKLFYERNPAAKKEDVLEGVLAPLGVSALDPTGKSPQDLPGQYLDKAKGVIALRGPDGKYREYSPNEYIRLLNQQRAMEQARLIAQTRAQLYGPQNP